MEIVFEMIAQVQIGHRPGDVILVGVRLLRLNRVGRQAQRQSPQDRARDAGNHADAQGSKPRRYCFPPLAISFIIPNAWSMVKLFGLCTAGNSLNVSANFAPRPVQPK